MTGALVPRVSVPRVSVPRAPVPGAPVTLWTDAPDAPDALRRRRAEGLVPAAGRAS